MFLSKDNLKKEAQHQVHPSADFFDTMINQIHHPVYVIDPSDSFRFQYVNEAVCLHYGYSQDQLLRMSIPDWDPNFTFHDCELLWQRIKKEKRIVLETLHRVKSGRILNVEVTASYLKFGDKEYISGFIQNIEERKQAEDRLKQAVLFRDQIMGVLGHDLRSPIASIQGFAELLRMEKNLSNHATDYIERIERACRRMTEMIETLIDFARSRFGEGFTLNRVPMNFHDVCRSVVDEMRGRWSNRIINVSFSGDAIGEWDKGRIGQVVSNLLSNALTHGLETAPVEFSVNATGGEIVLKVHNQGSPIPKDFIPFLFEPFRQGASRVTTGKGLGLGLFIVQTIVSAHGGTIQVESTHETGTTFTVKIPKPALT